MSAPARPRPQIRAPRPESQLTQGDLKTRIAIMQRKADRAELSGNQAEATEIGREIDALTALEADPAPELPETTHVAHLVAEMGNLVGCMAHVRETVMIAGGYAEKAKVTAGFAEIDAPLASVSTEIEAALAALDRARVSLGEAESSIHKSKPYLAYRKDAYGEDS